MESYVTAPPSGVDSERSSPAESNAKVRTCRPWVTFVSFALTSY